MKRLAKRLLVSLFAYLEDCPRGSLLNTNPVIYIEL